MPEDPGPPGFSEKSLETYEKHKDFDPDALRFFSRSPHPYHRRHTIVKSKDGEHESSPSSTPVEASRPSSRGDDDKQEGGLETSKSEWTGRKRLSRATSDSGSEADDEAYVRALPAPPIRPRKGLRDTRGSGADGVSSPLLTPSQVDEDEMRLRRHYFKAGSKVSREPSPSDEEAITARKKFVKRRRAELLRRTTEVALLGAIATAVVGQFLTLDNLQWHRGELDGPRRTWSRWLIRYLAELFAYSLALPALCALYALRLLITSATKPFFKRIHIPAAFDPATLLYPYCLPVLIVVSLPVTLEKALLPNLILSLSALPPRLIPFGSDFYSSFHWLIALLPLIVSENTEWPSKLFPPKPYKLKLAPPAGLHPEVLATLFALHHALLPPLYYLTTTSLLPTELQLLSIGLINLLLFAETPQMTIMSTLLWFGGISLFIFCGPVMRWGVALARIPKWRLRRAGNILRARQTFIDVLTAGLREKSQSRSRSRHSTVTDTDDDHGPTQPSITSTLRESLTLDILNLSRPFLGVRESGPRSAVESSRRDDLSLLSPRKYPLEARKRSNTLPNLDVANLRASSPEDRNTRLRPSAAQYYLSLTPAQAATRKWAYAGYIYLAMIALVFGPIRQLISKRALQGDEPFGWAISYLFSGVPIVSSAVKDLGLESWVPLPQPSNSTGTPPLFHSLLPTLNIDSLRLSVLGSPNTRLFLTLFYVSVIIIGLLAVLTLTIVEVDTRRKVFHGMMVFMFLPTIYIDPCFVSLAFGLILSIFLLLDLIRASQLPPLSRPLASFLTPYVDGRDLRGPVVISHIFLLIGCAIPLWLSMAALPRTGAAPFTGWEVSTRDVAMTSGVICVGMGDAAASLIGRRFGRKKWPWAGGKSLEGSAAFAAAVTAGLIFAKVWLRIGGWDDGRGEKGSLEGWEGIGLGMGVLGRAGLAASGASLMEAVLTGGNDNVVVPVVLWLLVKGLGL